MPPTRVQVQDAARVPDRQGADLPLDRPADDVLGGLVLGLRDPQGMPGLGVSFVTPVLPPPPRAPLAGPGRPAGGGAGAGLAVAQVLAVLGPDRPARDPAALARRVRRRRRGG
jgi:hypothetical protein